MSLNESIVQDAALEWFPLRQGYGGQIGEQSRFAQSLTPTLSRGERGQEHGPHLAPGEYAGGTLTRPLPQGEEKREAIRRLNPAIPHALLP